MDNLSHSLLFLLVITAAFIPCPVQGIEPPPSDPGYVGFIWHYPFVDVGSDLLAESGANAMMARCNWGTVQPDEATFNFASVKKQIDTARQQGLKLVLLLEFNPICSPIWLKKKCFDAGEGAAGFNGQPGTMPQINSIIYRTAQEKMVQELAAFLAVYDSSHTVTHYMPGIEWWFPQCDQYSAKDISDFRDWLTAKYKDISALNQVWGAQYSTFADVPAPGVDIKDLYSMDRQGLARVTYSYPSSSSAPTHPVSVANDWTGFWNEKAAVYIDSLGKLVKDIDPARPTVSFLTFAWAHGAEWDYINYSQVRLDSVARAAQDLDLLGMQLCFTSGDPFRITSGLDLVRKYGKPMWDMDLLDFVQGVQGGLESHLKATHAAIQHGASSLFYCCWNGARDFNFYPDWTMTDIQKMIGEAHKALDIVRGATIVTEGAILNPIVCSAPGDPLFGRNDVRSFMGWYKILERIPTSVDVLTLRELESDTFHLDKYRWILVPDCPYLSLPALKLLTEYASAGGLLIRGGRFAFFNENGVAYDSVYTPGKAIIDYGVKYSGTDLPRKVYAGDTPPQMIWRTETDTHKATLDKALLALSQSGVPKGVNGLISVQPDGKEVSCTLFQHKDYQLVYLLNKEMALVDNVKLVIGDDSLKVTHVYSDLTDTGPLNTEQSGFDGVLPSFKTSCIVQIESASSVNHAQLLH